jgi:tetratricopeptide (TPR) repeat protein
MTALRRLGLALLSLTLALMAGLTQAQTLEDIDVRVQGEQRIVRIRFNASVSFLQISPANDADLYTLRFEMLAGDEAILRQAVGESRRLGAAEGLPEMVFSYAADPVNRIKQMTVRLSRVTAVQARQGNNARSIELLIRVAAPAAASAASAPVAVALDTASSPTEAATPEIEAEAASLLTRARAALADRQADAAVGLLNQALKLPPHSQSRAAQELIGNAWEQADNPARARAEYALFLKLYPTGDDAQRVTQRLTALGGPTVAQTGGTASTVREAPKTWSGSLAQYYYGGKAKTKSLVNIATGIDQATISRTNESSIVTSVDLSGRYVAESSESRAVVRGSGSSSLLSGGHSSSSIGSVYVEHRRTGGGPLGGLAIRAGRQSPISGGLLGLFDGVSLTYPVAEGTKIDLMGGVPSNALVSSPGERLLAAVLEADTFLERFGGNFYLLDQSTQGITNRRALGAELRYGGDQWSVNTLLDHDLVFGKLNALSLHASAQVGGQTTVTLLFDERRAPSLQLSNSLISSGVGSLKLLLQTRSLSQIKADALATSAIAKQLMFSVSRPLSTKWQFSSDLRYSAVGALPAVGDFEATAATGGQYSWGAQLTGTNLYSQRDINNFNLSVLNTPFFKGVQFSVNNLTGLPGKQELTLEPSLRVYMQRDKQDVKLTRIGPGARLSWRASQRGSLLGELLYETSRTDGPTNHDNSNSVFFYVGYRYELF